MAKKKVVESEPTPKKRATGPLSEPDVAYCILAKCFEATRNKIKLADRDLYKDKLRPGDYQVAGTLAYKVNFSVGDDSEAARSFGVPIDTIMQLSFLYSGAMLEHLMKAAMIVREIKTAEIENRKIRSIEFTFEDIDRKTLVTTPKTIKINANTIAQEAVRLGMKLIGEQPEFKDDPHESRYRQLVAERVAECVSSIKVMRTYDGPINLNSVELNPQSNFAVAPAKEDD